MADYASPIRLTGYGLGTYMARLLPPHASDEYVKEIAKPIFDYFHIPGIEDLTEYDQAASGLAVPYSNVALAFRANILSTLQAASARSV